MAAVSAPTHHLQFERGIRSVAEPSNPGWVELEHDGSTRAWCSCGLDTGWVRTAEAVAAFRTHAEDTRDERWASAAT
ncbi:MULTISPECIES: hypothetical protein [unclassified Streptomyces]|uniref:hypothetical protein n=1 Tax=unclassified Streptomyces TaxID=2593676 RepID=UPI0036E504C8